MFHIISDNIKFFTYILFDIYFLSRYIKVILYLLYLIYLDYINKFYEIS